MNIHIYDPPAPSVRVGANTRPPAVHRRTTLLYRGIGISQRLISVRTFYRRDTPLIRANNLIESNLSRKRIRRELVRDPFRDESRFRNHFRGRGGATSAHNQKSVYNRI
ncbi:hypothetical protein EVAR_93496_1 [Eumeta japonica]|uniref:Uncharacterized protein n=1 Tax=Eumeta variegata TaxID=151549 RepID=A0A4C1TKA9_EUMVA|nr:hypothetical protein EVAR_93496_1 [Eumeta japonica]